MLVKKRNFIFAAFATVFLMALTATTVEAQDATSFQNKLKSILSNFNNIRFSSIAYYEMNDRQVRTVKEVIKKKLDLDDDAVDDASGINQDVMDPARADTLVNEIRRLMANGYRTLVQVRRAFNGEIDGFEDLEDYDLKEHELRLAFQLAQPTARTRADIHRMFLLTMPNTDPGDVPDIIALILCRQRVDKDEYEAFLIQFYNEVIGNSLANERNVLTHTELMNFIIDDDNDDTKTTTLYEQLQLLFRQGNFQLITPEVRGIGTELKFVNIYGTSSSMITNENDITSRDVKRFMRVSEGQAFDYTKSNELILGPDLISYRKYEIEYYEDDEGNLHQAYLSANMNYPSYGVEVRYGLEEINYPSLWSERMMVRAVWDNVKFGIILPTSGWASISEDLFNVERRFTHAGIGMSGNVDLPIKIIPQSGVFNINGSYLFGDAVAATYKDRNKWYDERGFEYRPDDLFFNDYLIRYTGQAHYTFGFSIDESYLFRVGIGATLYGAETWHDYESTDDFGDPSIAYKKANSETVGGISLKLDFMRKDARTPFGASLQYFDESISATAWLQAPVVKNTLFLRLELKGFIPAFKDTVHPWESKNGVFMFSPRLIFNF